jgi:hypothetical protein
MALRAGSRHDARMRSYVGYVRVSLADPDGGAAAQRTAIERWARGADVGIVAVLIDDAIVAGEALSSRLALGDALELVHEDKASGIVVARLERVSSDMLMQELIRADLVALGAMLRSADGDEDAELTGEPTGERARIRDILERLPAYRNEMRDLRVRARRVLQADHDRSLLSRIETLGERGSVLRELTHDLVQAGRRPRLGEAFDLDAFRRFVARRKRRD